MRTFDSDFEQNLYHDRLQTLEKIADLGEQMGLTRAEAKYPNSFPATQTIPDLRAIYDHAPAEQLEAATAEGKPVEAAIAGRIMAIRLQGKAGFAQLQGGGQRLQIYVRKDDVGDTAFALYKLLDLGDHIGVRGHLMRTRTGELTLKVGTITLPGHEAKPALTFLAKAMLALPDKYHGLEDVELRYRQRYVDLIMNSGTATKQQEHGPAPSAATLGEAQPPAVILSEAKDPCSSPETPPTHQENTRPSNPVILSAAEEPRYSAHATHTPSPTHHLSNPVILSEARSAQPKDPCSSSESPQPHQENTLPPNPVILSAAKDPRTSPEAPPPLPEASASHPAPVLLSPAKNRTPTESAQPHQENPLPPTPVILSAAKDPRTSPEAPPPSPETTPEDTPRNVRDVFVKRAAILRAIRRFFDDRGYLEVETPMMHTIAGGAAARPFKTHHNALDIPLSLRIAPELYLKRLVVGGLDRVYEINRNFRNEGVSTQHNPEFTMLEFYQAYSNYHDLMNLTEELVSKVATEVNGSPITHFNGHEIDLSKWTKLSMREAIIRFWDEEKLGPPPSLATFESGEVLAGFLEQTLACANSGSLLVRHRDPESQQAFSAETLHLASVNFSLIKLNSDLKSGVPAGKVTAELFESLAEPHLIQPTIIYDFPLAVSPLSKQKPDEPDWVERFEFYIGGFEVGNAFSELNDPAEQRKRFEQQLQERDRGDDEAHAMDEDYVRALGYGLPPTAGEGIGIDRLTMLLTGSRSIRDVILFPLMRPAAKLKASDPSNEVRPQ